MLEEKQQISSPRFKNPEILDGLQEGTNTHSADTQEVDLKTTDHITYNGDTMLEQKQQISLLT